MTGSVRELLVLRRGEISAKISALERDVETTRVAFIEAVTAATVAKNELRKIELALKTVEDDDARSEKPTIKQAVLEVLKQRPEGMTALEILAEVNSQYFENTILRTSLSPQLSRLKDRDRKIILRGNRWFLLPEQPSLFTRKS